MPIYEYDCPQCGHFFETLTSYTRADETPCPRCGAKADRLLSTFATPAEGDSGCAAEGYCPARGGQGGCGCSGMCGGH